MLKFYKLTRFAIPVFFSFATLPAFSAIFTVTNTSSNVATVGSLAWAIDQANTTPGADVIEFALPADQPCTIDLTVALPTISEGVFVNGYSQAGAVQGPIATRVIRVNINAAGVGGTNNAFTIAAGADNVTIAGLAIYSAPGYGIRALPSDVDNLHIWGNYIGTDSTGLAITHGATPLGNVGGGIDVNVTASFTASNNIVVGVNGDGVNDANEGNLIVNSTSLSGNNGDGVALWLCTNSVIAGNIIGLNKNGTGDLGNARDGIVVTVISSNVVVGTDGDNVSDAVEGNLIGGNGRNGILLAGESINNVIAGNTIGLDAANAAMGNGAYGIHLLNTASNRIGTDANGTSDALEGNVIGSNTQAGIRIETASFFGFEISSDNNTIQGNIIGTDASLTPDRGNGTNGIELIAGFSGFNVDNNIVSNNTIVNNNSNGIHVLTPAAGTTSTGNKFAGNVIYNNDLLGIDLVGGITGVTELSGVTVNDDGDGDAGANDLLNAPVISSVRIDGSNLVVEGFTRPGSVVEFFIADAAPNPNPLPGGFTKSFGQGQVYLFRAQEGTTLGGIADADATQNTYDGNVEGTGTGGTRTEDRFSFTIALSSLPTTVTAGTRITAVAYLNATGAGSTSEFGGVMATLNLPVHLTSFKGRVQDGKSYLTWTTTEEQNNSHFEIEKSTTGGNYTVIGRVAGKGGWYNNQYDFTDETALATVNYYRLKQVDLDGRPTYSKILILRTDLEKFAVKAGPNPFAGNINVFYQLDKEETLQIRLYDQAGRIVKQYTTRGGAGGNTYNISDLNSLPRGNYTLELTGPTVKHKQQVVKQ